MSAAIEQRAPQASDSAQPASLGMWVFIATEVLFFGGLLFAYAAARAGHAQAFALANRHTEIVIGTANTALLLTSSAAVAVASDFAERSAWNASRRALLAAMALGTTFLLLKGMEYGLDWRHGLFPGPGFEIRGSASERAGAQLFFTLYYLMTSLHALHMLVGLALLAWLSRLLRKGCSDHLASRVHVTGLYWHFVDTVWIILYPLLYLINRS